MKIAFDLDGVIAHGLDINGLNRGRNDEIYGSLDFDIHCLSLLRKLRRANNVYVVTARRPSDKKATVSWLKKHRFPYERIYVNYYDDYRWAPQYKAEVVEREGITILIDDTKEVVDYVNEHTPCRAILFTDWHPLIKELQTLGVLGG